MVYAVTVYSTTAMGSVDPAGLTYDPVARKLLMVDSEVDEKPFYATDNMFAVNLDGSLDKRSPLTKVTKEPTGITYNPATGTLFVTDDDARKIYEVSRSDPTVVLSSFSSTAVGVTDLEDICAAPDGNLFLIDEYDRSIVEVTRTGTLVATTFMPSIIKRPEAIAYDAKNDVFYVAGGWYADIYKVGRDGSILGTIKVLRDYRNVDGSNVAPKGLALVYNDDGSTTLWVADYGKDQVADGRLFSIEIEPPPPPLAVAVSDGTPLPQVEQAGVQVAFTLSLNTVATEAVRVTWSTVDGTAKAGSDFVGVAQGTVEIAAGATEAVVFVTLLDDAVVERTEGFSVAVKSAVGVDTGKAVLLADASGGATVADDDATSSQVMVYDAGAFGSPDPSTVTYVASRGMVLTGDSEVDENPFYSTDNVFQHGIDGTFRGGLEMTRVSQEVTGVAWWRDPADGKDYLFLTDDDQQSVFKVALDAPTVKLAQFSAQAAGCQDPEDITVDPVTGNLFLIDEAGCAIHEATQTGQWVATIALPSVIEAPEALAYDADAGLFYVSGYKSSDIFVVDRAGGLVDRLTDIDNWGDRDPVPKGLELVPDSDGSGMTLWVADYGADQVADGRIFVIELPESDPLVAGLFGTELIQV